MNLFVNFRSQNQCESTGKRREYEQEKKQTLLKIKEHHSRKQKPNDAFAPRYFIQSSTCNKPISRQHSYKVINNNRTCFGLWNSGLRWNQWRIKKEKDQILKTRSKVKSKLFLIFPNFIKLCLVEYKSFTSHVSKNFWLSM